VVEFREARKSAFAERHGFKLTYTAFIAYATVQALAEYPMVNSSLDGRNIIVHKQVHLGIATSIGDGTNLIVPVVRDAGALNFVGIAAGIHDLATRARYKKLSPDEATGGTFTITNNGKFGVSMGLPIINQPQVAILGLGGIKKRPVVINDAIAIRSMMYLSMSYDHRVVDGAVADQFLAQIVQALESFDESLL
jgi:2-oxoglutarate dehydrogenase E2 component (dihydrolipoamide succinyltransferase)